MKKLSEVEHAKALMSEAMDWSVLKWLWEKRNVREIADEANVALDRLDRRVKSHWKDEFKAAYQLMVREDRNSRRRGDQQNHASSNAIDPQVRRLVQDVKDMDEKAHGARMDAEETFDRAEEQLSTALAREGCGKAIRSWELHEKAIRKAEALVGSTPVQSAAVAPKPKTRAT